MSRMDAVRPPSLMNLRLIRASILALPLAGCGMPGGSEWMWIALIAIVLFGGAKLPGLMRSMGSGIHEFKKGLKEGETEEDGENKELKEGSS